MYSQRKGNTFVLFDCSPDSTTWFIVTNNHRFKNAPSYAFQCKKNPNLKFRISKCLTYFFHIQNAIPHRECSRKFFAIRRLLIEKHLALMNRITSRNKNYRQTKTYNKFSHYFTTFYIGFYIPCKTCGLPCSHVFSRSRYRCHVHGNELILTPKQSKDVSRPVIPTSLDVPVTKTILSKRLNLQYDKTISYFRNARAQLIIDNICYLDPPRSLAKRARIHCRRVHLSLHLRQPTNLCNLCITRRIRHNAYASDNPFDLDPSNPFRTEAFGQDFYVEEIKQILRRLNTDDERRNILRDFDININLFWIDILAIMDNRVRR